MSACFFHVLHHAVDILEISCVAELVYLVVSDSLDLHLLPDRLQVGSGSCNGSDAGAGEADLGCGGEFVHHVRVSLFFTLHQDLDQVILLIFI